MADDVPSYRDAFSKSRAFKAAVALAKLGGVASFSQIQRLSGIKGSTLT